KAFVRSQSGDGPAKMSVYSSTIREGGVMDLPAFILWHAPRIPPPEHFTPLLQLVLRWIHFIAGITWVGLLYFFNLVNAPVLKEADAPTRSKIVTLLMPRALWWF